MELCVSVGQGRESKLIGSVKLGDYKDDSVVLSTVESSKVVFLSQVSGLTPLSAKVEMTTLF